ncbi:MAG: hypothetical protein KC519_23345, partial [Anaerolineae bacterium]|nr:hypothetical protein [Anaerolineae bacterium]
YACKLEYTYAHKLGKPVLPVKMDDDVPIHQLPDELQLIQFVDYTSQDSQAAFRLISALNSVPSAAPLPDPLPEAPQVPLSYVGKLREQIDSPQLTFDEQASLIFKLKERLQEGDSPEDAVALLKRLRRRDDLYAKIDREIEELLPASRPVSSRFFSGSDRHRQSSTSETNQPPNVERQSVPKRERPASDMAAITISKRWAFLLGSAALFGIAYLFADSPLSFNRYSAGIWIVFLLAHGLFTQYVLGGSLNVLGQPNTLLHLMGAAVSGGPLNGFALRRLNANVSWAEVIVVLVGWGVALFAVHFAVHATPLGNTLYDNWDYAGLLTFEGGLFGLLGALVTWLIYARRRQRL